MSKPEMILPDLSNSAFPDFVGIFSLPKSKITISFETVSDVNGLPTVRLTLGYGRKVLDLSYLPVATFLLDLAETGRTFPRVTGGGSGRKK